MVLLTITQAADRLGFKIPHLRRMCHNGSIPMVILPGGKGTRTLKYFIEESVIDSLVPKEKSLSEEKLIAEEEKTQNIISELRIAVGSMKRSNAEFKTEFYKQTNNNKVESKIINNDNNIMLKYQNKIYERFSIIDNDIAKLNQTMDKILNILELQTNIKNPDIIISPPIPKSKLKGNSDNALDKFGGK